MTLSDIAAAQLWEGFRAGGGAGLESGGFAVDPVNNELRKVVRRL